MSTKLPNFLCNFCKFNVILKQQLHYVQGQRISSLVREYFYYIDHRGQLFLDDARIKNFTSCFKEKQFLKFFFTRLKVNESGRYEDEFPFLSPCGPELNFVRCDDLPVVYDKLLPRSEPTPQNNPVDNRYTHSLTYGGGQISVPFRPSELLVDPNTGRLYHPAPMRSGGIGLVGTVLAQQLSEHFVFGKDSSDGNTGKADIPTHINWNDAKLELTNDYAVLERASKFQAKLGRGL